MIRKASGQLEPFTIEKVKKSLAKSGASKELVEEIATKIAEHPNIESTKDIHNFAVNYLQQINPAIAARYNVRHALLELGPSGFPFEKFIAAIFSQQGYDTLHDQIVRGKCIEHEIDVIAHNNSDRYFVECKFHHQHGLKVEVKVTLYCKARFDDIQSVKSHDHRADTMWVITNAKFTSEAIRYADCVGIKLLGWSYPADKNLQFYIDHFKMHPITALVSLSHKQKRSLISEGLVLCRDARTHKEAFRKLGMSQAAIDPLIHEAELVCDLPRDTR